MSEDNVRKRPSWHEVWMTVARTVALRSHDDAFQVGAIVVSNDNTSVCAVGYNGNYAGGSHEKESDESGKSGFIHSELNCLLKCDFNFPKQRTMYVTLAPCRQCAKLLINSRISRVIYEKEYRDMSGVDLLKSAGVDVLQLDAAILSDHDDKAKVD
jgi:dCMP deaminase